MQKLLVGKFGGETLKINCKEQPLTRNETALRGISIAMPGERNERNVLRMSTMTLLWNTEAPQSTKSEGLAL